MQAIKRFIATFMAAITNCSLYSKEHASVEELTRRALSILDEILTDRLVIMAVDGDLIVNKTPFRNAGLHGVNLIKRFKKKGISRVDFLKGVTLSELKQFIADISDPDKPLITYPHIKAGVVDVRIGGPAMDIDIDIENLTTEQIERVKEVYHGISPFKKLNTAGLEEIVINFIVSFRKEANILKLISPVRTYSEYTYTHATNVAVLTIFQAESLGIRDELLHDIGIAALLHDVGKLFISKEILEKKGALDEKEWNLIKLHTVHGARYLAKTEGLTRLASLIALEHHLRYDGQGYPALNIYKEKQHFCSQIVAISDFFDALRSKRPYKRDWEIKEILALMKKNAGKEFNPFLVENFSRTFITALKEG